MLVYELINISQGGLLMNLVISALISILFIQAGTYHETLHLPKFIEIPFQLIGIIILVILVPRLRKKRKKS